MAELIPTATAEKNGLMSAYDKARTLLPYSAFGKRLYRIACNSYDWQRETAFIVGCKDGVAYCVVIALYTSTPNIKINIMGEYPNEVNFYKKDKNVYVFFGQNSGAPTSILMASTSGIEIVSTDVEPDSSYTIIEK